MKKEKLQVLLMHHDVRVCALLANLLVSLGVPIRQILACNSWNQAAYLIEHNEHPLDLVIAELEKDKPEVGAIAPLTHARNRRAHVIIMSDLRKAHMNWVEDTCRADDYMDNPPDNKKVLGVLREHVHELTGLRPGHRLAA